MSLMSPPISETQVLVHWSLLSRTRDIRDRDRQRFLILSQRGPALRGDGQRGHLEEVGGIKYETFRDIMMSGSVKSTESQD